MYSLLEIYKINELELLIFLYTVPFFARFLTISNVTRDRILVVRKLITESLLTVIYMYHTETLCYRSFKKAGQKKTKNWMIVSSLYILLKSLLSYERRMFHTLPKILRQQATKNLFYNFRNYRISNDTLYKHFICYKYSMNSC